MNSLIIFLNLAPELLAQYLDYALYGLIGFVALGFIFGFVRGIWREGFRLLFVGTLIALSVLFTRQLVNFSIDYDISGLASSIGMSAINLDVGSGPISVPVTTAYETINTLLEQVLLGFGFFITPQLSELIIALTLVLLRYLVFIILAILIFLLGETLAALLYFIPFRFLIPLKWRKKKKMRLLGGLAGATKMVLVLTMFLSPFTSLVNTISTSFKDFDEQYGDQIDSELYDQIMGYVNVYDQSTFSTVLFDWYISEDGKTIDTVLMDFISGEDIENYRLTLSDELDSIVDIAATLIGTGAIDASLSSIDTSLLLTESAVTNLILSLTGSTLVMRIIPIAVAVAFNLDLVTQYVDPDKIDFDAINWDEELIQIGDILSGVIRTGILQDILVDNAGVDVILPALFEQDNAEEIGDILLSIDESPFLSQVIPAVLYGLVEQEVAAGGPAGGLGLSTFLPTAWEDYETIEFGRELKLVYDLVYELYNDAVGLSDVLLETLTGTTAVNDAPFEAPKREGETPTLTSVIVDNFDLFVEVLLGDVDEDGVPINNDPVTGISINRVSMLDSDLIARGLPSLVESLVLPTLLSVLGTDYDDTELVSLVEGFNDGTLGDVRKAYKQEFAGLFSIVGAALSNDTLAGLLEPGATVNILDILNDEAFRADLKSNLIPKLDRSEMILTIVPGFLEATFSDPSFNDFLTLINITTDDLNFEFDSLSRELNIVIDMLGYALPILDVQSDLINQFPTISRNLVGLLDSIYASNILNLNPNTLDKATNYRQMIGGIFALVEGFGIEEADLDRGFNAVTPSGESDGWTTVYTDINGNGLFDEGDEVNEAQSGENYHLVNFLTAALDSGLLDISGDIFDALNDLASGSEDLSDPDVAPLYKIFAYADRSSIISNAFGGILDTLFGSTGGLLDSELGTSFRNVTSWEEEGSNLVFLVKQLTNFADGLNNLDFLNSDVGMVEELLQGLAASQIFMKQDGTYLFPDFLLNQLKGVGDISSYFVDPDPYLDVYDDDSTDDYTLITNDFYAISNDVETMENWFGTKEIKVDPLTDLPLLDANGFVQYEYVGGEIENIVGFIEAFQNVSIDDLTSGTNLSGDTISDLLLALNDAPSLRVLLYNIYDSIFGTSNFDIGSLSLSQTNIFVFLELDQEGRAEQIQATANLLDTIADMGLDGGGSFDIANFNETTIQTVGDLLSILHDAALFNSFKLGFSRDNGDLTVFEQAYKFLLTTSTLDTFIYDDTLTEAQRLEALEADLVAIDNNFGDGSTDGWNGETGEIQRFVDVMVAFVNTGIDFATFGGDSISGLLNTLEGLGKVETLLLSMNDSVLIGPAIGNLFGNIFESDSFNINGLNMGDSHTAFFTLETTTKEEKATEISLILDIYWDIQSIGLTGGGAFTSDLIDPPLFEGLLDKMYQSQVFNTFKSGNSYVNGDLTVFEQTVRMILNTSTLDTFIYDEPDSNARLDLLQTDISALTNSFGDTESASDWRGESGEIARIIGVLTAFKNTEIDFATFGGDSISGLLNTEPGLLKVENLLLAMNDSTLVSPSIGNLFGNIFESDSFNINGLNMADANTGYFAAEPNKEARGTEISQLLDVYWDIQSIGLTGGGAFTSDLIDPPLFEGLLTKMHASYVFNTFKTGNSYANSNLTIFEQTYRMILNTSTMDTFIYDLTDQPTRLTLLQEDISQLTNLFAGSETPDDWTTATTGEIARIIAVLQAFKDTEIDFASFSGAGSSDTLANLIDTEAGMAKIENLLLSMNQSSVLYPAIPHLFSNMLEGGDFSSVGVDFTKANFAYRGLRNDPNDPQIGDVYLPYQDTEISSILSIFSDVKVVGNRNYGSIKDLTDEAIDDMANLVLSLYGSQVFHQTGASTGVADDATIFEQMMIKMFKDTGMADLAYDGNDLDDLTLGSAENKAEYLVVNFSTLFPANNVTHLTDSWTDDDQVGEVSAFFRIFKELKAALPNLESASSIDASSLSPASINAILSVLNYSSLTSDAAKKLVKDAFDTISFSTYTEGNETYELSPVEFLQKDLSSMDYSLIPGTITQEGLIYGLLNGFYDNDAGAYINVGAGFNISTYLNDGNSLYPLLNLLSQSLIFGSNALTIDDPNALVSGTANVTTLGSIKTRSLTFYNLLNTASVGKYFDYLTTQESDKEFKVERVEEIFSGDFDVSFEATRLDSFIGILSQFTTIGDASTLDQYSSEMRQLIELTYTATGNTITDRAFMVSELSAGFFTDIFDSEYALVQDTNAPYFGDDTNLAKRINFYDQANDGGENDFANLNPTEADGLEGALLFLGAIKAVATSGGTPSATDVTNMLNALTQMGSKVLANVTAAGPYPSYVAGDYASWTSSATSVIAKLFYGARVVTNAGFTNLSNSMLAITSNPLSGFTQTSLSLEPYSTHFVFEIEGEKIQYVFSN